MRRIVTTVIATVLVAGCAAALAGCGGDSASDKAGEKAAEKVLGADDVEIDGDGDEGSIKIEGQDGKDSELTYGTELPDDFPKDVPLPDGADIQSASKVEGPDGATFIVSAKVDQDAGELLEFYEGELGGYTQKSSMTPNDSSGIAVYENGELTIAITVAETAGDQVLSLTVTPNRA